MHLTDTITSLEVTFTLVGFLWFCLALYAIYGAQKKLRLLVLLKINGLSRGYVQLTIRTESGRAFQSFLAWTAGVFSMTIPSSKPLNPGTIAISIALVGLLTAGLLNSVLDLIFRRALVSAEEERILQDKRLLDNLLNDKEFAAALQTKRHADAEKRLDELMTVIRKQELVSKASVAASDAFVDAMKDR